MTRRLFYWKLKNREIRLGERTLILGVLNVTPDSFSDGGKYLDPDRVLIVVVGNATEIREPLGTLGFPMHEMDIDGNMLPVG